MDRPATDDRAPGGPLPPGRGRKRTDGEGSTMIDPHHPDYIRTPAHPDRAVLGYAPACGPDDPAVSIVTPYYNTGEIFHETARSVLRQTLQNWEWIIVNDGSTDPAALAVLDGYRGRDPRIRVVDLDRNSGPSAARNAGFAAARAELVFQLDADDQVESAAIEKLAWFLHSHPQHSFAHGYEVGFGAQEYLYQLGFNDRGRFLRECLCGGHAVMVRRSAHQAVGGYDESIRGGMEDWEFWLRCADAGMWGAMVPEYLSWYRRRENHNAAWENWDGAEQQARFERGLRRRFPRLFAGGFPAPEPHWHAPYETLRDEPPLSNPLVTGAKRVLMILPWLRMGGADKWNLDLTRLLIERSWQVTLATTLDGDNAWLPSFAALTPGAVHDGGHPEALVAHLRERLLHARVLGDDARRRLPGGERRALTYASTRPWRIAKRTRPACSPAMEPRHTCACRCC